jgi:hypothetical protein
MIKACAERRVCNLAAINQWLVDFKPTLLSQPTLLRAD